MHYRVMYIRLVNPADDLPHCGICFHQPMRLRHLLPAKHLFRKDLEPARPQPGQGLLDHAVPQAALIRHVARAEAAALEPDPFADERSERDAGRQGGAAERSQVGDAAVGSDGVQVGCEVRLADEVDDDVDPFAARGAQDFLRPVRLRAVVESLRGAQGVGAEGQFFVAAGCHVDRRRARQLRELNPCDGYPGCARVPEDGLSTLEAAD